MGFGKDGKGAILRETVIIAPGTLGTASIVLSTSGVVLEDDFRIIKTEYFLLEQAGPGALGDTVILGIANGELSAAEIGEAIFTDGPNDRNDRLLTERAERAVWLLCARVATSTSAPQVAINDGMPMEKVLRWTFSNPEGWNWFFFNPDEAAMTGDWRHTVVAKHFGVWVT